MKVLIRGAGDIASGIALRLHRAGMQVVMTDLPAPTAIRRTVCFSQAILLGEMMVEDVTARRADSVEEAESLLRRGLIPVLADPDCACRAQLRPDALVDAILAKRNLGTKIDDAPVVVGIGPGFTAGEDCHAVVETMRGHTLGPGDLPGKRPAQHQHSRAHRRIRWGAGAAGPGGRDILPEAGNWRGGPGWGHSRRGGRGTHEMHH